MPVTRSSRLKDDQEEVSGVCLLSEDAIDEATRRVCKAVLLEGVLLKRALRQRGVELRALLTFGGDLDSTGGK